MKKRLFRSNIRLALLITFVIGLLATYFSGWQPVFAGTLTQSTVMEYNMQTSGAGNIAVAFKTASAGATSVSMNFNTITSASGSISTAGYSFSSTTLANCQALFGATVAAVPSPSALTFSTPNLSFTTGSLSTTTYYCAIITGTSIVTNPGTSNIYGIVLTVGSDSQTDYINVIANDQYSITGTIPTSFTLSLSGSTDTIGTLSATNYTTSTGITATVNTNALSGWMLWAADLNTGLHSTTTSATIPSVATGSLSALNGAAINTNAYALGVVSVTSGSATANYTDTTGYSGGGLTPATTGFNEIASYGSPAASDAVLVREIVDISAATKAASDYTDTITLVGAGSF